MISPFTISVLGVEHRLTASAFYLLSHLVGHLVIFKNDLFQEKKERNTELEEGKGGKREE